MALSKSSPTCPPPRSIDWRRFSSISTRSNEREKESVSCLSFAEDLQIAGHLSSETWFADRPRGSWWSRIERTLNRKLRARGTCRMEGLCVPAPIDVGRWKYVIERVWKRSSNPPRSRKRDNFAAWKTETRQTRVWRGSSDTVSSERRSFVSWMREAGRRFQVGTSSRRKLGREFRNSRQLINETSWWWERERTARNSRRPDESVAQLPFRACARNNIIISTCAIYHIRHGDLILQFAWSKRPCTRQRGAYIASLAVIGFRDSLHRWQNLPISNR